MYDKFIKEKIHTYISLYMYISMYIGMEVKKV